MEAAKFCDFIARLEAGDKTLPIGDPAAMLAWCKEAPNVPAGTKFDDLAGHVATIREAHDGLVRAHEVQAARDSEMRDAAEKFKDKKLTAADAAELLLVVQNTRDGPYGAEGNSGAKLEAVQAALVQLQTAASADASAGVASCVVIPSGGVPLGASPAPPLRGRVQPKAHTDQSAKKTARG